MTVTADPVPGSAAQESRLVTISAAYGAGGSVVAPALAQRLGVPFLQRMTTAEGDVTDSGPCAERLTPDEASSTPVHRLLASFTQAVPLGPTHCRPTCWRKTCAAAPRPGSAASRPTARA